MVIKVAGEKSEVIVKDSVVMIEESVEVVTGSGVDVEVAGLIAGGAVVLGGL